MTIDPIFLGRTIRSITEYDLINYTVTLTDEESGKSATVENRDCYTAFANAERHLSAKLRARQRTVDEFCYNDAPDLSDEPHERKEQN